MRTDEHGPSPITWPALLAHYCNLARASLALPDTPESARLRAALPHLINLHAVTHALRDLDRVEDPGQRALAADTASHTIATSGRRVAECLEDLTHHESLVVQIRSIMKDANDALCDARARAAGGEQR